MSEKKPLKRIIEMVKLRKEGLSYAEIGYTVGLSRERVHKLINLEELKRQGIDIENLPEDKGE